MKILVVDDDPNVRELLGDFLRARGYGVESAGDGRGALDAIRRFTPDLLLLDLMMPGVSGMEVLRQLSAEGSTLPVIVITAVTDEETGRAALGAGASDYVTKPIDLSYLEKAISATLLRREI